MAKNKKILIVEDEKSIANALKLKLENSGYESDIALNGREALEMLEGNGYSLVLLDLVMPVMDGFGVLEEMKKKGITTPVLISTNLSQEEDEKRAKELGAKDFFVKSDTPITEVINQVDKYLD